jgi:hypothetical protein
MAKIWGLDLSCTEKIVLLYYADRSSDSGTKIWPSKHTVAKNCSLTERTAFKLTKMLVQKGYLEKVGMSRYRTVLYRINLSKLIQADMNEEQNEQKMPSGMNLDASISDHISVKPSLTINKPSLQQKYTKKNSLNPNEYVPQIDKSITKIFRESRKESKK